MIPVDRSKVKPPDELFGPASPGLKEFAEVIAFYANAANKDKAFNYKAYKIQSVKDALHKLFHGKCAYCETNYEANQPVDIEHFRPKGRVIVNGKPTKPGYYWLASSWENLLPSCIDCNRERRQDLGNGRRSPVGKKDKFPIFDEGKRATKPGDEKNEKPLLLNPCTKGIDPSKYFVFTEEGAIGPRFTGKKGRMAMESIDVFGLARRGLAQARRDRATLVLAQIERVNEANEDLDLDPSNKRTLARLKRETAILKALAKPTVVYSAMARQLIKRHLRVK